MFTDAFIDTHQRDRAEALRRLARRRRRAAAHHPPAPRPPRPRPEVVLDEAAEREPVGARR